MEKHLLAFVTDKEKGEVFVHADLAGVNFLIKELEYLRKQLEKNDCPHTHLFSAEWGTGELSISSMIDAPKTGMPVHHLKIYGWNEEWVEKHGLVRS